jgi:hypothetical protein
MEVNVCVNARGPNDVLYKPFQTTEPHRGSQKLNKSIFEDCTESLSSCPRPASRPGLCTREENDPH